MNKLEKKISTIPAYILSGGESKRFGDPKCYAQLNGKALYHYVESSLRSLFNNVYSVGKKNLSDNLKFIPDMYPISCSMNGIYSALVHSKSEFAFILSCDMPFVSPESILKLYDQALKNRPKSSKGILRKGS